MSDGRKVRLADTSPKGYGKFIEVELRDDAAMPLAEAMAEIDQCRDGWERDDKIAEMIVQCPELFEQYWRNQSLEEL